MFSPPREASLSAFAFDGASLYLVNERQNGAIVRIPKSGAEIRAVVYFTVQGSGYEPDGAVLRAAKMTCVRMVAELAFEGPRSLTRPSGRL